MTTQMPPRKTNPRMPGKLWPLAVAALATLPLSQGRAADDSSKEFFDSIWKHAEFYKNPDNDIIQSFKFTGRFQLNYALVDQNDVEMLDVRRFRMGAKIKLFKNFTLHSEVDLDTDVDPVYQRLTDTYLSWSRSKAFEFTVGKQSAPFTVDGMTSSKELMTIDRSNLANNLWFPNEYFSGVSGGGEIENWHYFTGVYSSGSASKEFGNFDGGWFTLASLGYDLAEVAKAKKALLSVNYVYNTPDGKNSFTRALQHVGSLNLKYEREKWGLWTDMSGGTGYGTQSPIWGLQVQPFYNLTDKLQGVLRYTYLNSTRRDGIRYSRYESVVIPGRGDNYHELYAGLNYYFYGHKLKLQTGVQHVQMDDDPNNGGAFNGWALTTGLRVSW